MKFMAHPVLAATAITLADCATITPYQPASKPGGFDGYSQTILENDRARISFGGNSLTDRGTVENYLLYRAAEMAVERGFDHFILVERDTEAETRINMSARSGLYDPYFRYSFFRPRYGWSSYYRWSIFHHLRFLRGFGPYGRLAFYDPWFDNYSVREITRYRASAEVRFGRGAKPPRDNAFNAHEILQNLGPSIVFPKQSTR